jgi:hypothetical protein
VQRCVNLWLPERGCLVELYCCGLDDRNALLAFLIREREVVEALVDGGLLHGELERISSRIFCISSISILMLGSIAPSCFVRRVN